MTRKHDARTGAPVNAEGKGDKRGRGRQSLDGTTGNGPYPKRQVRLPRDLDTLLDAQAECERRRSSEIIRDALDAYLRAS